jgi:hypothetical protein
MAAALELFCARLQVCAPKRIRLSNDGWDVSDDY